MDFHEFSSVEVAAVKSQFPKLGYISTGVWKGALEFDRVYRDYRIIDNYEISIAVPATYPDRLPHVSELGGRVVAAAKKHSKDVLDAHWSSQNGACLCVKQEEKIKFPSGSDMVFFIENLVIPYFYGLSYFEEYGRWPWREYSHGCLGLLEFHAEDVADKTAEMIQELAVSFRNDAKWEKYRDHLLKPKPKRLCPCGSGKTFPDCHRGAWNGLIALRGDLRLLNLDAHKLFSRERTRVM